MTTKELPSLRDQVNSLSHIDIALIINDYEVYALGGELRPGSELQRLLDLNKVGFDPLMLAVYRRGGQILAQGAGVAIEALARVEELTGDDFTASLEAEEGLSAREQTMRDKLLAVYRISHAHNPLNPCYDAHADWRDELAKAESK